MKLTFGIEKIGKVGILGVILAIVFVMIFSPFMALAQDQIVPECGGAGGMCGYCDLMKLSQNIIEFLVFFAIIVATLMIIYAGFLYLTAGSNSGQIAKGHSTLRAAIFGLVIVLASYLIINLILVVFGVADGIGTDPWNLPGC